MARILGAALGLSLLSACAGGSTSSSASSSSSSSTSGNPGSSSSAGSSSATSAAGVDGGCGTVTFEGECNGQLLRYCDEGDLIEVDCADGVTDGGYVCSLISIDYGYNCAAPAGAECIFEDEQEGVYADFCTGMQAGCLVSGDTSQCTAGIGPCTEENIGVCAGGRLLVDCQAGQPWLLDCAAAGGMCGADHCVITTHGSACDDETLVCGSGLTCDETGTCIMNPDADAGAPPDPDAGVGPDPDGGAPADAG